MHATSLRVQGGHTTVLIRGSITDCGGTVGARPLGDGHVAPSTDRVMVRYPDPPIASADLTGHHAIACEPLAALKA